MDEPPHVEGCPGCQAANLAEEDRVYLRSTGWTDPRHVLAPRPQMAPPPEVDPAHKALFFVVAVPLYLVLLASMTWSVLAVTVLVGTVTFFIHRQHKMNHRKDGQAKPGCNFCRREDRKRAAKEWFEYRRLADADRLRSEREAHATHYQQLREQERRRQQDGQ